VFVIEQHALHNLLPIAQELFEDKEKNRNRLVQHFFITDEFCTSESQPKCQYFNIRVYFHLYIVITLVGHMS
jgi:hypothetical protein